MLHDELDSTDKSGMFRVYDRWPSLAERSYGQDLAKLDLDGIKHIVLAGMGGSGLAGDIIQTTLLKQSMRASTVKGYLLPKDAGPDTLVVVSSVSGNTHESMSVLKTAHRSGLHTVAFSGGGRMEQYCTEHGVPFRRIEPLHSPRASLPVLLYSMLNVLSPVLPVSDRDVTDSISALGRVSSTISSANLTESNDSLRLAEWIGSMPLIYCPFGLMPAAIRFKNSLQENAKIHAMTEDLIESSHNAIESWERGSGVTPVMIRGADDSDSTRQRWDILREYLARRSVDFYEVESIRGDILSKLVVLIYTLDYASIYLAVRSGTDPTPTRAIDFVKSRLD